MGLVGGELGAPREADTEPVMTGEAPECDQVAAAAAAAPDEGATAFTPKGDGADSAPLTLAASVALAAAPVDGHAAAAGDAARPAARRARGTDTANLNSAESATGDAGGDGHVCGHKAAGGGDGTAAAAESRVLLVTNEVSKAAKCGNPGTNQRYEQLMDGVEALLRKSVAIESPLATRVRWEHRLSPGDRARGSFAPVVAASPSAFTDESPAREASDAELLRGGVHSSKYLSAMSARTAEAIKRFGDDESMVLQKIGKTWLPSAGVGIRTEAAAKAGVAALIDATLTVLAQPTEWPSAFVLCRPPTHHAVGNEEKARNTSQQLLPYGFCHLNGISSAVAAARETLIAEGRPGRVAILDVDVHAGNGNEDTWYDEPNVLHVNLNEAELWPGEAHGDPSQTGGGKAKGSNLNFPMPSWSADDAYCYALTQCALPAIKVFGPDLIIVACGFDALRGDPYASMDLTPPWFGWLAAELREAEIAPFVFNLEGGYDPGLCCKAAGHVLDGLTGLRDSAALLGDMGLVAGDAEAPAYTHRGTRIARPAKLVCAAIDRAVALHAKHS